MNNLYMVGSVQDKLTKFEPTTFAEMGVKERQHLENWVVETPELLGEPLLIITSEFAGFETVLDRLDVLALDKRGKLVVVELKLTAVGGLVDLQAIRYAAYCSCMQMEDIVHILAETKGIKNEDARQAVRDFLQTEELPVMDGRPRIVLAAASFDDKRLTTSVLWLRKFDIDISCVEIAPYTLAGASGHALVPRVLLPVPQTKNYTIDLERHDAAQDAQINVEYNYRRLWKTVSTEFGGLRTGRTISGERWPYELAIKVDGYDCYYGWHIRKSPARQVDVGLFYETRDAPALQDWMELLESQRDAIALEVDAEMDISQGGKNWVQVRFQLPYDGEVPDLALAKPLAQLMAVLIDRTAAMVETLLNG